MYVVSALPASGQRAVRLNGIRGTCLRRQVNRPITGQYSGCRRPGQAPSWPVNNSAKVSLRLALDAEWRCARTGNRRVLPAWYAVRVAPAAEHGREAAGKIVNQMVGFVSDILKDILKLLLIISAMALFGFFVLSQRMV